MDSPKFAKFNMHSTPYKVVNGQDIPVYTLVPKGLQAGTHCPIIVFWHGGFFVTGSAIYPDWITQWSIDYALLHHAIIINPEYQLLPESTGLDILSDISDFWTWLRDSFPGYISSIYPPPAIAPDLHKVLCYGVSAGGWFVIQSILHLLADGGGTNDGGVKITAAFTAYAMFDGDNPKPNSPSAAPQFDPQILDKHIESMTPGKIVVAAFPPERMQLALIKSRQGRHAELMGSDERLSLLKALGKLESGRVDGCYLFAFHGLEDTLVPAAELDKIQPIWERVFGKDRVRALGVSGEHGFDVGLTLDTPWLIDGLVKVTEEWLGANLESA